MDGYLWRGAFLTQVLEMLNHHNKFMLFRLSYIVIIFFWAWMRRSMSPLICHYVFLLRMAQLTTSSWGRTEGDLLSRGWEKLKDSVWEDRLGAVIAKRTLVPLGSSWGGRNSHSLGLFGISAPPLPTWAWEGSLNREMGSRMPWPYILFCPGTDIIVRLG